MVFSLSLVCRLVASKSAVLHGLVTDANLIFDQPEVAKPEYLRPIIDPVFGTKIIRIAGDANSPIIFEQSAEKAKWGNVAIHRYSKEQFWNSDNTLLVIENREVIEYRKNRSLRQLVLDGTTYKPKFQICPEYNRDDDRWNPNPKYPHIRINAGGNTLEWFDVVECKQVRKWDLPVSVSGLGMHEGNPSLDGRFVVLADKNAEKMFVVDMDPQPPFAPYPNKRIGPLFDASKCGLACGCVVDWVSVSPSGKYAVMSYNGGRRELEGDYPRVFDIDSDTLEIKLHPMPAISTECALLNMPGSKPKDPNMGYIYDLGHADMTLNPFDHNEDVIIGQSHDWCPLVVNGVRMGSVVMVRLRDNKVTTLTMGDKEAYAHHISTRNFDRPGWAYVSYWPGDGLRFGNEVIAVKIDGSGSVERLAYSHSNPVKPYSYLCEVHVSPSRDGKRALFASSWSINCDSGCGSQMNPQTYVVEVAPDTGAAVSLADCSIFAEQWLEQKNI
jgi:hypothetical protein